jgi:putative NIF3 family GTP cyclohydrolase 1 type 2
MTQAHPYEEAAYDLYPLMGGREGGSGRIGRLDPPLSPEKFLQRVKKVLKAKTLRVTGRLPRRIETVAVCTGSGKGLIADLADGDGLVFLTGEIDYHSARRAELARMSVVEVGHFASERIFVDAMTDRLGEALAAAALELRVIRFPGDREPFRLV